MDVVVWIIVIVALIVIAAIAWSAWSRRRTGMLQDRFGPEYDRTATEAGGRREAESELASRVKRREAFDIRPLDQASAVRYADRWRTVQERFVDSPSQATADADQLVQDVMRERGYPIEDFDQRAADLSVDHAGVVDHYRAAHGIAVASREQRASTEDLRQAVVHYRALVEELLVPADGARPRLAAADADERGLATGMTTTTGQPARPDVTSDEEDAEATRRTG
jgi:hypothetical protein